MRALVDCRPQGGGWSSHPTLPPAARHVLAGRYLAETSTCASPDAPAPTSVARTAANPGARAVIRPVVESTVAIVVSDERQDHRKTGSGGRAQAGPPEDAVGVSVSPTARCMSGGEMKTLSTPKHCDHGGPTESLPSQHPVTPQTSSPTPSDARSPRPNGAALVIRQRFLSKDLIRSSRWWAAVRGHVPDACASASAQDHTQ